MSCVDAEAVNAARLHAGLAGALRHEIAVCTGSNDVLSAVPAALAARDKMFSGAAEASVA